MGLNIFSKEELKSYLPDNIVPDDYEVTAEPIIDSSGRTTRYKIAINHRETEQYTRFAIPYHPDLNYTKEHFKTDLYRKIVNCIRRMMEEYEYNNSNFATLGIGETFLLGRHDIKALEWKVIRKTSDELFAVCTDIICNRHYHPERVSRANHWDVCELRKWMNSELYDDIFTPGEKACILPTDDGDKLTLLTKEEAERLLTEEDRAIGKRWWLRTPYASLSGDVWFANEEGKLSYYLVTNNYGVRPAIYIRF